MFFLVFIYQKLTRRIARTLYLLFHIKMLCGFVSIALSASLPSSSLFFGFSPGRSSFIP